MHELTPTHQPSPRRTAAGTPCSPAWDDAHIAVVEAEEARLGARICGARTLSGGACGLAPNHENGRCKFHGGFDLTGGQPGNRNGVIHGLYSRCVQTCGDHCPMWKSCPCAGPEVMKLAPAERPRCPYETAEYNAVLTDTLARVDSHPDGDGMLRHTAHHIAMLQVMLLRAAAAMAANEFVPLVTKPCFPLIPKLPLGNELLRSSASSPDNTGADSQDAKPELRECAFPSGSLLTRGASGTSGKESPYLLAYMRISGELRRYQVMLDSKATRPTSDRAKHALLKRAEHDTSLLPEDQEKVTAPLGESMGKTYAKVDKAYNEFYNGSKKLIPALLAEACAIDADYAQALLNPESKYYVSKFERLRPFANAP